MFEGKTVLVTGGAGSIGSGLIRHIMNSGADKIISFDSNEIDQFMMKQRLNDSRLEIITADIRNASSLENVFMSEKIDLIYHAAAMKHIVTCEYTPAEAVGTNILGTQNIIDMAVKYKTQKTILISTDKAAYPMNVMGSTKFIAERITLNGNLRTKGRQIFSCVRFGNVANTRGSVIPVFVHNILDRKPLYVTDMRVTRFIMRLDDTIELILKATQHAKGGEIFVLRMNAFKLSDLVDATKERIAPRLGLKSEDVEVIETGLVPGEKLHEDLVNESETVKELDGMFVTVLGGSGTRYSSKDTKMLTKDELENIILDYIEQNFHYSKLK